MIALAVRKNLSELDRYDRESDEKYGTLQMLFIASTTPPS